MIASLILQIAIPDSIGYLAALCAAGLSIWAMISKIRNSGKAEVELMVADRNHEEKQNKKIEDVENLANNIKKELEELRPKVTEFEGAVKRVDRLERQLDELLILLVNADY